MAAEALGIPQTKIVTKVKRIGGAYGGKTTRVAMVALPAVIASQKMGVPIRCMLDRCEDLSLTGGRHPSLMKYKVGFDDCGKVIAYDLVVYLNGGRSLDVMSSMVSLKIINFKVRNTCLLLFFFRF